MTNCTFGIPIICSDASDDCFSWSQEAITHFNQTAALKQMLSLVGDYLNLDSEVRLLPMRLRHFEKNFKPNNKKRPLPLRWRLRVFVSAAAGFSRSGGSCTFVSRVPWRGVWRDGRLRGVHLLWLEAAQRQRRRRAVGGLKAASTPQLSATTCLAPPSVQFH